MCNTRGCPTIGSTLELIERELIQALSDWVAGYQLDPTLEVENKVPEKEQLLSSAVSNHDLLLKQNGNLYDLLEQESTPPRSFWNVPTNYRNVSKNRKNT